MEVPRCVLIVGQYEVVVVFFWYARDDDRKFNLPQFLP